MWVISKLGFIKNIKTEKSLKEKNLHFFNRFFILPMTDYQVLYEEKALEFE